MHKLDSDIEKYLINDSNAEEKYKFCLREVMEDIRENGPIFKDFLVVCSPSTRPYPHEVKQIVESSGGKFSEDVKDLGDVEEEGDFLVVADVKDKKFIKDVKKVDSQVKIVTPEAFMLSVMRNELVVDKKYLL